VPAKAVTLQHVAELIAAGQTSARERWDDLKSDFDAKHKENTDRRHALMEKYAILEGRVTVLERDLRTVVGDNTGGSGLLHAIDKKVDKLQEDFSSLKSAVEDAPAIRKWVYGAIAVLGFLAICVPIGLVIVFEVLKLARH
jgi:predicted nuclease with TOPRIM domain